MRAAALTLAIAISASAGALAQEDPSRDREARGLFDAGVSAYEGGRYDEALRYFQRSYELSGRHALLYNIGSAAERAREDEVALQAYEEYLRRLPDADNRPRVETRVAALRDLIARGDRRDDPPPPTRGGGGGSDPAPWIVFGSGAVVAIVGGILLGLGLADRDTVENPPAGVFWNDVEAAYERGPALLTSGVILLPVGIAAMAGGLVWALIAPAGASSDTVSLRLGPTAIQLHGRF